MKSFNVIIFDINRQKFISYDIMPYLLRQYNDKKEKPTTFEEFKYFINSEAKYQWWARCEYEMVLSDWPPSGKIAEKWDVYKQVEMNLDIITKLFMDGLSENN